MDVSKSAKSQYTENHMILFGFFHELGGDLYIKDPSNDINGQWIIQMDGTYYDENGILNNVRNHGRNISFDNLDAYFLDDPTIIAKFRSKYEQLKAIYFSYIKIARVSIMDQLEKILGYTEIEIPFKDYEGRVYLIRYNGEMRIMRIFDSGEMSPTSPEDLVAIHRQFSALEICPHVYASGIIYPVNGGQASVYIVMDYVPMTLDKIEDKRDQAYAIREAIKICYKITSLGYFGIDDHAGNFLYDQTRRKVYAIDFAQLTKTPTEYTIFRGKIRNLEPTIDPQENNQVLHDIEQLLVSNNADNYLNYFLRANFDQITNGNIILILAPINAALDRLSAKTNKSLEQILGTPEGKSVLENSLGSIPIQQTGTTYSAINGASYGNKPDDLNLLRIKSKATSENVTVYVVDAIIYMPGQIEKLTAVKV